MLNAHWPLSFCRNLDNNLTYDKHTNTFFTSKTSRYTYIQTSRPVQSWLTWGLFSKFKDKHFQNDLELPVSISTSTILLNSPFYMSMFFISTKIKYTPCESKLSLKYTQFFGQTFLWFTDPTWFTVRSLVDVRVMVSLCM